MKCRRQSIENIRDGSLLVELTISFQKGQALENYQPEQVFALRVSCTTKFGNEASRIPSTWNMPS